MSVLLLVAVVASVLVAWVIAAAWVLVAQCVPFVTRARRTSSTALRAGLVLGPALVALLTLLVVLVPTPLGHCHCVAHGGHHPHLCVTHPWLASPVLGFALPLGVLWLAFTIARCWPVLRELFRAERWASELRRSRSQRFEGVEVRLIDNLAFGAFTVGIFRPVVVVDRLLWTGLEPRERLAVVHHEHAHAQRRDALTLACLRLVSAALPWPAKGAWLRAWQAATEAVCDRHAAAQLQDATCVAMALVSVERLRATAHPLANAVPALGVAAGTDLETRVRCLLDDDRWPAPPLANDLLSIGIVSLGLATLLLLWPGSALHHAAESLLGVFVH